MAPKLPQRLVVHNSMYFLDGGTTCLSATDEAGDAHQLVLAQHLFVERHEYMEHVPGRLYFDGQLVPLRSEAEARVIGLLRRAEMKFREEPPSPDEEVIELSPNATILGDDIKAVLTRGPEENLRAMVAGVIEFVSSEEYEAFADRVERSNEGRPETA